LYVFGEMSYFEFGVWSLKFKVYPTCLGAHGSGVQGFTVAINLVAGLVEGLTMIASLYFQTSQQIRTAACNYLK